MKRFWTLLLTFSHFLAHSQNIYQIITDRFYDGDPSNDNADGNYDPAGHRGTSVHGGDFKGIEEKLDYIKALGATAIWISPVVLNARGEFHGYAGRDFYKVDPHWGSLSDLQHMIRAAHTKGIEVIDDVVVNHGGDLIDSADPDYPKFKYPPEGYTLRYRHPTRQYPPPFGINDFHSNGVIQNYNDNTQRELGELSGLDDFRTETPFIRTEMTKIYEFWIEQAGFDGFRVDSVPHVEMGFWQTWCPAIHDFAAAHGKPHFFMFGEVLNPSDAKCASYTGPAKLDSVLDYPLYFNINSVFARADGNTKLLQDSYNSIFSNYDLSAQTQLVTFLDNHDQPRFLSTRLAHDDTNRLSVALAFLYTARGIPCLYYGTEQAFNGGRDPYDREDMFAGQFESGPSRGDNFNMTHPLFKYVAMLNNFRRLYPALSAGAQAILWSDASGPGLFVYARRLERQEIFAVLNTAKSSRTLPDCPTSYPPRTLMVNLLDTNETATVLNSSHLPSIEVPGMSAKIFIAKSRWLPLDPVVASVLPSHDSRDVATNSPIVIKFSEPMETARVEAVFSIAPSVSGAYSWSSNRDVMTFTPGQSGLPSGKMIEVHIAEAAGLHGGFESRFQTSN